VVKEGIYWFLVFFVLAILSLKFFGSSTFYLLPSVFFLLSIFVLYFFRNPERKIEYEVNKIYSPADGRIMEIEEKDGNRVIKIFMNVFDCHVQRSPFKGIVERIEYKKGKFLPAYKKEAENLNEQNLIEFKTIKGKILVKQIAGILARRISCFVKEGQEVNTGEVIGMIKLGSQVDLILPYSAKLYVKEGDKVFAGKTPVAEW